MIALTSDIVKIKSPGASWIEFVVTNNDVEVINTYSSVTRFEQDQVAFKFQAFFPDESYIPTTVFTVTATDNTGCSQTYQKSFTDPCSDKTISIGFDRSTHILTVTTNLTEPYQVQWSYDENYYNGIQQSEPNKLFLEVISETEPPYTQVIAVVTDKNGCEKSVQGSIAPCIPSIRPEFINSVCAVKDKRATVTLIQQNCVGINDLLWDTVEFDLPTGWRAEQVNGAQWRLEFPLTQAAGTVVVPVRARCERGFFCDWYNITVTVNDCATEDVLGNPISPLLIADSSQVLDAGVQGIGNELEIEIPIIRGTPDYNQFEFIEDASQSQLGGVLSTSLGDAELTGGGKIKLTFDTTTKDVERIRYRLKDLSGNPSNVANIYIDAYNLEGPTATGGTFTGYVQPSTATTVNMSSKFTTDMAYILVETEPTKGTWTYTANKKGIIYTGGSTGVGLDTITVRAYTYDNIAGDTQDIELTILNAGEDNTSLECESVTSAEFVSPTPGSITYDLTALLSAWATGGGTWSADAGNPSVIATGTPSAVDFSSASDGTYLFTYTVTGGGVTDSANIYIVFKKYVVEDSGPTMGYASKTMSGRFAVQGTTDQTQLTVKILQDLGSGFIEYDNAVITSYFLDGGVVQSVNFSYNLSSAPSGDYSARVYVSTTCGTTLTDDHTDTITHTL